MSKTRNYLAREVREPKYRSRTIPDKREKVKIHFFESEKDEPEHHSD